MTVTMVASDMHIGYEKSNYGKIEEFFEICENDVDKIILNGDIFDLWRMGWNQIMRDYSDMVDLINRVTKDIPVIYVLGNHDWRIPIKEFPQVCFYTSYDFGGVHYEHGWRFDLQSRRYGWLWDWIVLFYAPWYQKFFKSPSEIILEEEELHWFDMHDEALSYGINHVTNVVVGHSHSPQVHLENGLFVADCGDFVDSCSYLKIIDSEIELEKM